MDEKNNDNALTKEFSDSLFTDSSELFAREDDGVQFHLDEQAYRQAYEEPVITDDLSLPLLGSKPAGQHMRTLVGLLLVFALVVVCLGVYAIGKNSATHSQAAAATSVQLNTGRLEHSLNKALSGDKDSFAAMRENYNKLRAGLDELSNGGGMFSFLMSNEAAEAASQIDGALGKELGKDVELVLSRQEALTVWGTTAGDAHHDLVAIKDQAKQLRDALTRRDAPVAQILAASDLAVLAEQIDSNAQKAIVVAEGGQPRDAISKNLAMMESQVETLSGTSSQVGAAAPLQGNERGMLEKIRTAFTAFKNKGHVQLELAQDVVAAQQAAARVNGGIDRAMPIMANLHQSLADSTTSDTASWGIYLAMAVAGMLALLSALGLMRVQLADTRRLQQYAEMEQQRAEAENSKNQTAILRLMDELQNVAEGDLTQEATVTEEITGAIADSVNSTVEELRALVGNVQDAADKVAQTTADVELTSSVLLDTSTEQLNEIQSTGESVLNMAERINQVSAQAQESVRVAQHSRQAAEKGYRAVQNAIDGMNVIRDQIQDTAKRIKRLGESSQEIGEITELISDITEQTNVLALNAAIQAASAGEAGRGFSVVAEEVQRLAERSAEATKQISALVKTIQTDTHDAVAAMERSTQGVVQGAHLSDNAGQALTEIDRVSRQLADLIQKISVSADEEAKQASVVAEHIQQIFTVTENTTEGTRTTSQQASELAKVAQELRSSVARFKIK